MAAAKAGRRIDAEDKILKRETDSENSGRRGQDRKWRRVFGTARESRVSFCGLTRDTRTLGAHSTSL